MEWIATIQKAITYMENHILEEINYEEVAKHVHTSSYEFHRAFSFLTGMTANTYIRNRRLSLAGNEIMMSDAKITDIALKYGYETPASFTKAFTRFHGVSPAQAKKGEPIQFMSRYTVRITIEGGSIMEYKIEKWESMDLLVHAKDFNAEASEKEIPAFWNEYFANKEYSKVPSYLGVCAQNKTNGNVFKYGIGCKASDVKGVPEGFEIIHVPEYDWAIFKCVGPSPDAIQAMWERIYKEWLPVAEYELIPDVDLENYLPGDPASQDYVSEICIPVKKKN